MPFLTVALSLLAVSLGFLVYVRVRGGGEKLGSRLAFVTVVSAFTFGAGVALLVAVGLAELVLTDRPLFATDSWQLSALGGAIIGAVLFLLVRVAFNEVSLFALNWSLRQRPGMDETALQKLSSCVLGLVGFAFFFAALFVVFHTIGPPSGIWLLPAFVAFATVIPLWETMLSPWLQFLKAPRLTSRNLDEVEQWLADLGRKQGVPRFQIRVQDGDLVNAYAIGGFVQHLVVIGGGLLDGMSSRQVKAILAHELAHVMRRDVPRLLLPMAIVSGTLYYFSFYCCVTPLFRIETVASLLAGSLIVMAATYVLYILIPGFFMRRMEFRTDRLAVDLLDDGEALADALLRLAELNEEDIGQRYWSHPSIRDRVKAIRALSKEGIPSH